MPLKCLKDISVNPLKVEEHEKACTLIEKVTFKVQAAERGVARDILAEPEDGNYGILVIGRRGSKGLSRFMLGSKANKLLLSAHAFMVCLVN